MVPLKGIEIKATLEGALATVNFDMTYSNPGDSPIECTYEYPLEADTIFSNLVVSIDDKVIEATVQEKAKAQEKYEDVVAGGNLGVIAERKSKG